MQQLVDAGKLTDDTKKFGLALTSFDGDDNVLATATSTMDFGAATGASKVDA